MELPLTEQAVVTKSLRRSGIGGIIAGGERQFYERCWTGRVWCVQRQIIRGMLIFSRNRCRRSRLVQMFSLFYSLNLSALCTSRPTPVPLRGDAALRR